MNKPRVGIVGLGAMGAATAYALSRRGVEVVGFDSRSPPHTEGSTHGLTRVTRVAYHEDPAYVPLAQRAQDLWRQMEQDHDACLLHPTGALLLAPEGGEVVEGVRAAANGHGLEIDDPGVEALRRRYPQVRIPDGYDAVVEPAGGVLEPETAVRLQLQGAKVHGATLHTDTPVTAWGSDDEAHFVETSEGRTHVDAIVLAAGPWMSSLIGIDVPLQVERQVQHWFRPQSERFTADRFPVFLVEEPDGRLFYGTPDLGDGVKVAAHHGGLDVDPDDVDRSVHDDETRALAARAERFFPGMTQRHERASVCLYTDTPELDFVIDRHPDHDHVVVCGGFSGHGFKFSPAVGEICADLATGAPPKLELAPFRLSRF